MKAHTSEFKAQIPLHGRELDDIITFTIDGVTTELGNEELNSITPHYEGAVLKSVMKQLDIDSNVEIPVGTILTYDFGVKTDDEYEYITYGNYVVKSVEKQEDTNSYKITCYDKLLYSMKDYDNSGISFPITIKDYLEAICTKIGLTYEGSQFANSDKIIEKELYLDTEGRSIGYTYRNVLDEISAVAGGTICINADDEVEVRYIHDVGELSTATGSNIAITDSQEAELSSFELEGKTTQETDLIISNWEQGSSLDNNATTRIRSKEIFKITKGKTYKLTWEGTNASNYQMIFNTSLNKSSYLFSTPIDVCGNSAGWSATSPIQFTSTNDGYLAVIVSYRNGTPIVPSDVTNLKITLVDFMPSPDYPSELVSVGYQNLFVGGGTTTNNSVIFTKNDDGSYDINGTASAQANNYNYVDLVNTGFVDGKTYTFYANQQLPSGVEILCEGYNGSSWVKHILLPITNSNQVDTRTISFGTSTRVRFTLRVGNGTNVNISNLKIMIVEGNKQLSYVPLNKYGIEIKTTGKNLFDKNNANVINGYLSGSMKIVSANDDRVVFIPCKPNTKYYVTKMVQATTSSNRFSLGTTTTIPQANTTLPDFVYLPNGTTETTFSITTGNTAKYLVCGIYHIDNSTTFDEMKNSIQIEQGTQATTYEEYKENTYLYTLDNPLRSIGNTKDLLYIKNGMLYVERKIGSIILDGTESDWGVNGSSHVLYRPISNKKQAKSGLLSNYYKYTANDWSQAENNTISEQQNNNYIFIKNNDFSSVNNFKTWLGTHNTEVQYILATPYTEELGAVQTPSTYEGVTYIDAPNTINISYIDEFEEIDEEYLKDVNVNFGEKFGSVNTVILSRGGDGDKIALSIPENLADEDKVAIQITDNQIMNGNDRDEFLSDILNQLYGLEYYINDFSSTGICYLDLCDRYRIKIGDTSYKCVMFNDNVNRTQGLEENIYTDMPEASEQEYKYIGSTDRGITQANIIANKAEATITEYTQKVDEVNNRLNAVETKQTDTDRTINILSTHIDADGDITEVTTTTGFTFNADGMTIADSQSNFSALHRNDGTYYKDGNTIVGQYTKDGSKQKDLQLFGVYYYGMRDFDDTPMFVAQLYNDSNGEECFGHFYNRGD